MALNNPSSSESWLTPEEGEVLLQLARKTIEAAVKDELLPTLDESQCTPGLLREMGAFVTLKKNGELRGCIGEMNWNQSVYQNVIRAACASALHDPRFFPVSENELSQIRIEITILSPLRTIKGPYAFDILKEGIIIELGARRAVFLPQVARETGWSREELLENLCHKAGLSSDAWLHPKMVFKVFSTQIFSEK